MARRSRGGAAQRGRRQRSQRRVEEDPRDGRYRDRRSQSGKPNPALFIGGGLVLAGLLIGFSLGRPSGPTRAQAAAIRFRERALSVNAAAEMLAASGFRSAQDWLVSTRDPTKAMDRVLAGGGDIDLAKMCVTVSDAFTADARWFKENGFRKKDLIAARKLLAGDLEKRAADRVISDFQGGGGVSVSQKRAEPTPTSSPASSQSASRQQLREMQARLNDERDFFEIARRTYTATAKQLRYGGPGTPAWDEANNAHRRAKSECLTRGRNCIRIVLRMAEIHRGLGEERQAQGLDEAAEQLQALLRLVR